MTFVPVFCDSIPDSFSDIATDEILVDENDNENIDFEQNLNKNLDDTNFSDGDIIDLLNENPLDDDLDDMASDTPSFPDSANIEKEEHLSMIDSYNQQIFEKACIKRAKEAKTKFPNNDNFDLECEEDLNIDDESNELKVKYFLSKSDDLRRLLDEEEREFQINLQEQNDS